MILVGNQRGGAKDFALHLIKEENEHVEVHELRGFASENLGYHPVGGIRISPILFVGSHCGRRFTPCALNDCPQASLAVPALTKAMPKLGRAPGLWSVGRSRGFERKKRRREWAEGDLPAGRPLGDSA